MAALGRIGPLRHTDSTGKIPKTSGPDPSERIAAEASLSAAERSLRENGKALSVKIILNIAECSMARPGAPGGLPGPFAGSA